MWAADSGKCDVVTELISLGADVDIQDIVSHFLCLIMTLANGSGPPNVIRVHSMLLVLLASSSEPTWSSKWLDFSVYCDRMSFQLCMH